MSSENLGRRGSLGGVEAKYWEETGEGNRVHCLLCPQDCVIAEGRTGKCRVRRNVAGRLVAEGYGEAASLAIDPIEKKPLYHFLPGSQALSLGPNACNLSCKFCQNWQISQENVPTRRVQPSDVVRLAQKHNSPAVSYTYSEPLMWYEFILDTGGLAHESGIGNVMVSNGYINETPLEEMLPLIDAWNIDLKSMDDDFYQQLCGARVEPVLQTIRKAAERSHVEVTNLVIPGYNDKPEQVERLIDFVADVGTDIPLHISRYFPCHQLDAPPTPADTLEFIYRQASERLRYVYVGNARVGGGSDTLCPKCGNTLIHRSGYLTDVVGVRDRRCSSCGRETDVVWELGS